MTKMAILAAASTALISQSARAGFTTNHLYLGFTESTASADLILDVGQASSLINATGPVDLSADLGGLSSFNSSFGSSPNGVVMAVVGGNNTFGAYDVYATQVRSGGAGDPTVAGSSIIAGHSSSQMSGGAAEVASIMSGVVGGLPTAGNSALDTTKSYTSIVDATGVQNNFIGKTGVNPTGTLDTSGLIYEDLYFANVATPYTYEGYFTFNYTADTLTFTPALAVPEPGSFSVFAGGALLILSLRNQLRRRET